MDKIKIISEPSESQPFIVLYKASGLPSAPISADDEDNAFSLAAKLFPDVLTVSGRKAIEHGLLHRLDTVTSGLLMIATNQAFYEHMLEEQKNGRFIKYYEAECLDFQNNAELLKGFPPVDFAARERLLCGQPVLISSYFRNYGAGQKEVRPVCQSSNPAAFKKIGKQVVYNTEIKLLEQLATDELSQKVFPDVQTINNLSKNEELPKDTITFECKLTAGYRHQVRAHLAWLGFPIIGDQVYNYKEKQTESQKDDDKKESTKNINNPQIHFTASKLTFTWKNKVFSF